MADASLCFLSAAAFASSFVRHYHAFCVWFAHGRAAPPGFGLRQSSCAFHINAKSQPPPKADSRHTRPNEKRQQRTGAVQNLAALITCWRARQRFVQ